MKTPMQFPYALLSLSCVQGNVVADRVPRACIVQDMEMTFQNGAREWQERTSPASFQGTEGGAPQHPGEDVVYG